MISAATAATAVLMVTLVRDHGLQYLLAATVLAGLLQIGAGLLRLGFVMRYVSKSVMTGFVNAPAILILMAQLPELDPREVTWITYALVAAGLAIIYLFPLLTTAILDDRASPYKSHSRIEGTAQPLRNSTKGSISVPSQRMSLKSKCSASRRLTRSNSMPCEEFTKPAQS